MAYGKMYRRAVKKSGTKKYARKFYKVTGLANPIKKGRISSTRIAKDVAMLKKMINAEKKETSEQTYTFDVAQVNFNNNGYKTYDVTPIISQGVTGQTRNGNSVKLHSMVFKGQLLQQSNNHHQGKVKIEFFLNKGTPFAPWSDTDLPNIYNANTLNTIHDINSTRATDTFKNWIKVGSKTLSVKQDNYSGVQGWRDFVIPLKFKSYHLKYDDGNTNAIRNGQLIMVVLADSGNSNGTNLSTITNIPVTAILTGFRVVMTQKTWYYDN